MHEASDDTSDVSIDVKENDGSVRQIRVPTQRKGRNNSKSESRRDAKVVKSVQDGERLKENTQRRMTPFAEVSLTAASLHCAYYQHSIANRPLRRDPTTASRKASRVQTSATARRPKAQLKTSSRAIMDLTTGQTKMGKSGTRKGGRKLTRMLSATARSASLAMTSIKPRW